MNEQIKNLDNLIHLPDKKIQSCEVKRLTAPGENYGSLMLSLHITLEGSNGNEKLSVVAKTVPPNEFIQELFMTSITFRNEIAFYKHIIPTLQDFQKESGVKKIIDFSPKYYGSRLNLTGTDNVDENAVLVLENLKLENYRTLESSDGLDIDTTKLILADLAHLHAVSLGYKLLKPLQFAKKIKPFLGNWKSNIHENMKQQISELIDKIQQLQPLKTRLLEGFDKIVETLPPREPFATIVHNDCWTNNNMVKFEGRTPIRNKLVDYQVCGYGSPARDIIFFLFGSVKNDVIKKNYNDLVKWYHQIFVSILEELNCDTKPFSLEALEEEIDFEARNSQFGHIAFMLFPIFAVKDNVQDVLDMSPENILSNDVTELHKEKFVFVVEEFVKRNWV